MEKPRHRKKMMACLDSVMDVLFELHTSLGFAAKKVAIGTWAPLGSDGRKALEGPDTAGVEEDVAGPVPALTPRLVGGHAVIGIIRPQPNDSPMPEPPGTPNCRNVPVSRPNKHGRDNELVCKVIRCQN